jgi:leucine dehydrogenase
MSVFDHNEFDQHENVAFINDKATGLRAIIAVHNTALGPSLGGCRMYPYANSAEALTDVLRLAKGMTYKAALANLPQGGGKSVIIADPRADKSPELMRKMGSFVDSLQGQYIVAEDSGIAVQDIKYMAEHTEHAGGLSAHFNYLGEPADGNPSPATAYGVFVGMQAAVDFRLGKQLSEVTVAIQGLGQVGYRLAQHLHAAGAKLIVADTYQPNVERACKELGAVAVDIADIHKVEADVFSPCAMGASINADTIDEIKAVVVAGAANNQLATDDLGEVLQAKGILYAPDYVINAAGIIDLYHQSIKSTPEQLKAHIESIADTLTDIFKQSQAAKQATNVVANLLAEAKFKK